MPRQVATAPFVARVKLDDDHELAVRLPVRAAGSTVIFADRIAPSHTIRNVLLRQTAILNYVLSL